MKVLSNGIAINVLEQGSGDLALVFLHYWGGSARTWGDVIPLLADSYRCVAIDHRGWGESDKPAFGHALADLANDADGVIKALQISRFALVGHSMGGKVAQLLASRRPAGLVGLVLIGPSPPAPTLLPADAREQLLHAYDSPESIAYVRDHVLTAMPLVPAQQTRVVEDSSRGSPAARLAWPTEMMAQDIRSEVSRISVPTLVLSGAADQVDPPARLRDELLPYISGAELQVLPAVGHLSMLEAPAVVAEAMSHFLRKL